MAYSKFNYRNYLDQNKLKEAHRFQPLFEAIENAFNSIEERIHEDPSFKDGKIEIHIHRINDATLDNIPTTSITPPLIHGFSVVDNGVGFRPINWNAYQEVYTSYKKARGGKGVGRLSYLQAFDHAEVDSIYIHDGKYYRRTFKVMRTKAGTSGEVNVEIEEETQITILRLESFIQKLQRKAPKALHAIASQIVEHFFKRLSVGSQIAICVRDEWDGAEIDLKKFCNEEMVLQKSEVALATGAETLHVTHTKCRTRVADRHQVHLCADGRVVASYPLGTTHVPAKGPLANGDNKYFYVAFVEGGVLNQAATQDRLGFTLSDRPETTEGDKLIYGESLLPSIEEIIDAVGNAAKEFLKSDIEPLLHQHRLRIETFCRSNVMYLPLLKQKMDQLMLIPVNLPDAELEQAIWKIYHDWKSQVRHNFSQMAKTIRENVNDFRVYRAGYREALRDLNQMAMHELAMYILDRRAVIDFLWDRCSASSTGKFQDEDAIHDIFFPRKETSMDIAWDESNLWLIDERLAFQQFAASDLSLSVQMPESKSQQRPDVSVLYDRVFDETFAFTDSDFTPYSSVTLIEFKKPERKNYDEKENPVAQAVRYIKEIREKKVFTHNRHIFRMSDNAPIHIHVICHIVDELRGHLDVYNPIDTPDGEGLIIYLHNYKAYVQISSFEKLIADARKRNEGFFRKLGIDRHNWQDTVSSAAARAEDKSVVAESF
jgi:hypothetical protein